MNERSFRRRGAKVQAEAVETVGVGAKREAILDAALALFAEQGFHGTAVPEIAKRAGIGAGTIYRYFPSKEAVVNALYQYWKTEIARHNLDNFPATAPFRQQFHVFWERMATFVRKNPTAFAFLELHHHAPYLDEESLRCEFVSREAAKHFIEVARTAQSIKDLPAELMMAIVMGAFVGVVKANRAELVGFDEKTLEQAERCAWEAIRR
jgi:TetR/AcrR family transcriptional regulator, repressor of fatR-cypB operon